MRPISLPLSTTNPRAKAVKRIIDPSADQVGLRKALRAAYRTPANDVPEDWQRLLDRLA